MSLCKNNPEKVSTIKVDELGMSSLTFIVDNENFIFQDYFYINSFFKDSRSA